VGAAAAKAYAKVGASGFTGAVDGAAHDGDVEVLFVLGFGDGGFNGFHNGKHVAGQAAARGAGNDVDAGAAQTKRFQDLVTHFHFVL